jgi:hypothetical protein
MGCGGRTPRPGGSALSTGGRSVTSPPSISGGWLPAWPTQANRRSSSSGITRPGLSAVTCGRGSRPITRGSSALAAAGWGGASDRARAPGATALNRKGSMAHAPSPNPLAHRPARTHDSVSVMSTQVDRFFRGKSCRRLDHSGRRGNPPWIVNECTPAPACQREQEDCLMFRIIRVPAALDNFFSPWNDTFIGTISRTSACWS